MNTTTKTAVQQALDENIAKTDVSKRSGGGSKELSYLEAWYVIDRLNQILGQGQWGYQVSATNKVYDGKVTKKDQYGKEYEVNAVSYTATVALFAVIEGKTVIFSDVGYGDSEDRNHPGKAHEKAIKEAVSDAVKRAAKNLGRSVGLALYDKTQEFVGEAANTAPQTITKSSISGSSKDTKSEGVHVGSPSATTASRPVKELVTAAFKILEAQKKVTKDEFKTKYLGGKGISSLTPDELSATLTSVKKDFPQLQVGA